MSEDLESICLCVKSSYEEISTPETQIENEISAKKMFFYSDGSTVFWNVPHLERDIILHFLRGSSDDPIEDEPFDQETIEEESEMIIFSPTEKQTHFSKGSIKLR